MQINLNIKSIVKWVAILVLAVWIGYVLKEITYNNALVMLIILYIGYKI